RRAVLARNPEAVQLIVDRSGGAHGMFAYLPLNRAGAAAIVAGQLTGARPVPALIAPPGETPAAIYFWLTYAPGRLGRTMGAIGACLESLASQGCPVFSRAVTPHAEKLNRSIGFRPAREIYPDAPEWLLVAPPLAPALAPEVPSRPHIEIRFARTIEEMMQVFAVRSATYLAEQFCLYSEEFDGNDFCATQLLGLVDGDAAGCARLRWFGDFAKLERVAVRAEYRATPLARRLARAALDHCAMKGFGRVYGHSRADLVPFWKAFGFRVVEDRPPFAFANIAYREMVAELAPAADAIRWGGDPMVAIRQEGSWNEPGPLELSNLAPSAERAALIGRHTRTLRTPSSNTAI
ncbi:MAG: GNAT family N-acetyltransferase, partial [Sphingomonadaceae bacterium]|nr:GNAT family N-acetyltransferase [Sphingomonadaceae bacterium]